MNVQDLLVQTSVEDILAVLGKRYTLDENQRIRFEATHRRIIRQLLETTPVQGQYLMVGDTYEFDGEYQLAISLYLKEELAMELEACGQLAQMRGKNLSISDMEKALEQFKLPQSYSTLFVPWAEITGCSVSSANVIRCGKVEFLAAVLYEITFYGFDEETIAKEQAELDEALAETESGQTTISIEDLWKELGMEWDDKAVVETRIEQEERVQSLFYGWMRTYEVLREIVDIDCCTVEYMDE